MPVVQNIVKDAQGAVVDGTVTIELVIFDSSNNPQSFQGFIDIPADNTSDYTINIPATVSIVNGSWQATLKGNSDIADAYGGVVHTYYKISEAAQNVTRTYYIDVPLTGGPYWTGNIGAFDPETLSSSLNLDFLTDVDTTGQTDGNALVYSSGLWIPQDLSTVYQPLATSGTWTPTIGGGGTKPATWSGSWEKIGTKTYHVAITCLITGTWSGVGTITASLPNTWTRHATQTMHIAGAVVTNAATPVYFPVKGFVEPTSVSNTAPIVKFITPNTVTTSYDWKLVSGAAPATPIAFANGYRLDVSGTVRVG